MPLPVLRAVRVLGILLSSVAGLLVYTIGLLSFVSEPAIAGHKWLGLLVFAVPAALALIGGLALRGFENWRRTIGTVLTAACGASASVILMFATILSSPAYRQLVRPETKDFFSDYLAGGLVNLGVGALGLVLLLPVKTR